MNKGDITQQFRNDFYVFFPIDVHVGATKVLCGVILKFAVGWKVLVSRGDETSN